MIKEIQKNILEMGGNKNFYSLIMNEINRISKEALSEQNIKGYFFKKLHECYGSVLGEKIYNTLEASPFFDELEGRAKKGTGVISDKKNNEEFFETEISEIEANTEQLIEEILENERISKEKIHQIKKSKYLSPLLNKVLFIAGVAIFTLLTKDEEKKEKVNSGEIVTEIQIKPDTVVIKNPETTVSINNRFNEEIYNSLSEEGKQVYKCWAESDPTPGRCYQLLDKKKATMYTIGPDNTIIDKFPSGFGKTEGDEPTSPIESGVEVNTTPAGIYAISTYAKQSDSIEYEGLVYSLFGKSVRGEDVFISEHETYKGRGELKKRTKAINGKSPKDNKFSDGCINIQGFEEKIKKYFKGDYGEFLIILPDEKSEESGVKFDINYLLKQISSLVLEMLRNDEIEYEGIMTEARDSLSKLTIEIANLEAEKDNLIKDLVKNPETVTKTKRVEGIKQEISVKKSEISEIRKILGKLDNILKEIQTRREKTEERLNISP